MSEILGDNIETNYQIGDAYTFGYILKTIKEIRKDENGYNEYLLSDGKWVSGRYITFCSD